MSSRGTAALASAEENRDAGLVRAVGVWGLSASTVNIVIGAGIFAVPAALAGSIGPYAPLAFLVCAVAIGAIAICFAEAGSRMPTSGGAYGYIDAAFGPVAGYVSGTLLWFGDALACAGVAAALGDTTASLAPAGAKEIGHAVVVVGTIGCLALVNMRGVSRAEHFIGALTMAKLIPIAIFIVAGAGAIHRQNFAVIVHPGISGLGRAVTLAMFAFTGMEVTLSASGEIARPSRTIPRALAISMASVTLVYVSIQIVAQGLLGAALGQSTVPMADGMARIGPGLRMLMLFGAGLSMFSYMGSDLFGSPRILFAFARDGFLPEILGRVHPRTHTPHFAIAGYAVITICLALSGTFAELAVLATLATAVVYILGCAAAWRLARGGVALAGSPLNFRWLGAAMVIGIGSMLLLISVASRAEILGLLAITGISAVVSLAVIRGHTRQGVQARAAQKNE